MCKGSVFNIQRFSTSDGPGIRTVVFFKGCPLDCAWCHNPESKNAATDVFFKRELCIGCGACGAVCGNHSFADGLHRFDRQRCASCGKCAEVCATKALEACGEMKTVEEIIEQVLRDRPFYDESGGGVTLSGGEPLLQYDFALALLQQAKRHGLHTAIETSGFSAKDLQELNACTDLWLYDVKLLSEEAHLQYTGVSNRQILENLRQLDAMGANIILRCPVIPDVNLTQAHFEGLAALANSLQNVAAIHLETYHPLGISKSQQLNKKQAYNAEAFLEPSAVEPFAALLRAKTDIEVCII